MNAMDAAKNIADRTTLDSMHFAHSGDSKSVQMCNAITTNLCTSINKDRGFAQQYQLSRNADNVRTV